MWGFAALGLVGAVVVAVALSRLLDGQGALSGLQAWILLALGMDGVLIGAVGWWAAWVFSPTDQRMRVTARAAARLGGYLVAAVPLNLFIGYYWIPRMAHLSSPLRFPAWAVAGFTLLAVYMDFQVLRSAWLLLQRVHEAMKP